MAIEVLEGQNIFEPGTGIDLGTVRIMYNTVSNRLTTVDWSLDPRAAIYARVQNAGVSIVDQYCAGAGSVAIPGEHYAIPDPYNQPDGMKIPESMTYHFTPSFEPQQ